MAKANIGGVQKLVVVGDGGVAAIGTKGTIRFWWEPAVSRGRVDELDDVRVEAAVRYGYLGFGDVDLADMVPVGAVIPLPSEKRAKTWLKQNRRPKQNSRWYFESAIQAGFRPRYYLGEAENPYELGSEAHSYWGLERVYLRRWANNVVDYPKIEKNFSPEQKRFMKGIPDWQTRALVASMVEGESVNGEWEGFGNYLKATPLL